MPTATPSTETSVDGSTVVAASTPAAESESKSEPAPAFPRLVYSDGHLSVDRLTELGANAEFLKKWTDLFGESAILLGKPLLKLLSSTLDLRWLALHLIDVQSFRTRMLCSSRHAGCMHDLSTAQIAVKIVSIGQKPLVVGDPSVPVNPPGTTWGNDVFSAQRLRDAGSCPDYVQKFQNLFGRDSDVKLTFEVADANARHFDWQWAVRAFLTPEAKETYYGNSDVFYLDGQAPTAAQMAHRFVQAVLGLPTEEDLV